MSCLLCQGTRSGLIERCSEAQPWRQKQRLHPPCPSSEWVFLDADSTMSLRKTAAPSLRPGWRGQCQDRWALPLRVSSHAPLGVGPPWEEKLCWAHFCWRRDLLGEAPGQSYGPPISAPSLYPRIQGRGQGSAWGQRSSPYRGLTLIESTGSPGAPLSSLVLGAWIVVTGQ